MRQSTRSLIQFTKKTLPSYRPTRHHHLIAEALERVERGEIDRLIINMPPRHGKSELASRRFPAWFIGRNPDKQIICCSYNDDTASDFGREVRNIVASEEFSEIFHDVTLAADSKAANRWNTNKRGCYVAAGVGGGITGKGAHILLIDDPIKDREEAESEITLKKINDWYTGVAYTRLMPGGAIVLIQCMTGDTPVLMADGTEKPLKTIKTGDKIVTYDNGNLAVSTVKNWQNQGPDYVFTIRTKSGLMVRANKRHPFLIYRNGESKWTRLKDLKIGDQVFTVQDIGENGVVSNALTTDAKSPPNVKDIAHPIITKQDGHLATDHPQSILNPKGLHTCDTDMELNCTNTKPFLPHKAISALYAGCLHHKKTHELIGEKNSALTTTTPQDECAACSATIATYQSDTEKLKKYYSEPLNTYEITHDCIVEIIESGLEDVFDIQVDRTENFIANGLVSHNTRWDDADLAGTLIEAMNKGEGDHWEILLLPAIDEQGKALWPEWYDEKALARIRKVLPSRDWNALYQQNPIPEKGDYFQLDWIQWYWPKDLPKELKFYGASDYAVTDGGGDYTEHGVFGVDEHDDLYAVDWWYGQTKPDVWIDHLVGNEEKNVTGLAQTYKTLAWAEESGQIQKSVGPFIDKRQQETGNYFYRKQYPSTKDKPTRARSFQGRAAQRKFYLPRNTEWADRLLHQLLRFPAGKLDDGVDVCSLLSRMLAELNRVPTEKIKPKGKWPEQMTLDEIIKKHGRIRRQDEWD